MGVTNVAIWRLNWLFDRLRTTNTPRALLRADPPPLAAIAYYQPIAGAELSEFSLAAI
jgi:chromosome segregation and condensation protein ScpB